MAQSVDGIDPRRWLVRADEENATAFFRAGDQARWLRFTGECDGTHSNLSHRGDLAVADDAVASKRKAFTGSSMALGGKSPAIIAR